MKQRNFNKSMHVKPAFTGLKYLFSLIIISMFFFSACNKELGENLLGDRKNQNPFSGSETLLFIDNNGDSIVFYGDGRSSYLFESESSANPRYYYTNESDECRFVDRDGKYKFTIQLASRFEYGALASIHMYYFDVENCDSHASDRPIPLLENFQESVIDTLKIRNKLYTDVFPLNTSYSDCSIQNEIVNFYYCISHGIIKIEFEDGAFWELESIVWE